MSCASSVTPARIATPGLIRVYQRSSAANYIGPTLALRLAVLNPIAGQLERYLDLLSARQKLTASNIANADTPGYRTRDIDFQSEFRSLTAGPPKTAEVEDLPIRNDGNNVSIDRESRMLAENALRFQLASNLLRSEVRAVRAAIQEGKSS